MSRIHLAQTLDTHTDAFTYTQIGSVGPIYVVESDGRLFKDGTNIGKFELGNNQWHLHIDGKLYRSGPVNGLFQLPEFELKAITALVNGLPGIDPTRTPEHALKDIAAQLVPMGARAGSVYQELLSLGYLVPVEDCKAEVERLLAEAE